MKKEENPPKEALNATAFAQFFSGPGRGQAGMLFAVLGIVGHDGNGTKDGVNPSDQTQAPIGSVQPLTRGPI